VYSLSIWSRLTFLISFLKSFWTDIWRWFEWSNYERLPFSRDWVVAFEVLITVRIRRFLLHFRGQFRTPFPDQDAPKYLNCATFSKHLFHFFMSWFCPAFWWRHSNIYLDFCVFTSRPTSLLASIKVYKYNLTQDLLEKSKLAQHG
jgi:hypothetical protein